jgi:WD40 repeat protein
MTKVTAVAAQDNSVPLWSPIKDNEMVFSSLRNGKWGLYLVNGAGREELLVESELPKVPMSWSPDGKFVVYTVTDPKTLNDLWILPLDEPAGSRPLISSPYNETHAQISPNGRWIAYVSNETGSDQIWVQSFPSGDRRPRQVTTTDARFPRWRVDGKELFYRDYRARMIAVEVDGSGAEFKIGEPTVLFTANAIYPGHSGGSYYPYAVSSDGQRFLLSIPPGAVADAPLSPITVVLNWQRLLTQ